MHGTICPACAKKRRRARTVKAPVKQKDKDRPARERIYRYRVDIRDVRDGSVRSLPLRVMTLVYLGGKKGAPPKPNAQVLRLEDDTAVIEAKDIDDARTPSALGARLRG